MFLITFGFACWFAGKPKTNLSSDSFFVDDADKNGEAISGLLAIRHSEKGKKVIGFEVVVYTKKIILIPLWVPVPEEIANKFKYNLSNLLSSTPHPLGRLDLSNHREDRTFAPSKSGTQVNEWIEFQSNQNYAPKQWAPFNRSRSIIGHDGRHRHFSSSCTTSKTKYSNNWFQNK